MTSALLPADWDARAAADRVLAGLVPVTAPAVRGAHDADFALVAGRAYIVYEANDVRPGESADWPFVYCALSVVDLATLRVERVVPVAHGGQAFAHDCLPAGACFVPRIWATGPHTLRVFFASEAPGQRQSQTWYRDFDTRTLTFAGEVYRARLRTAAGTFDLQPRYLYEDAVAHGFQRPARDAGLYLFDSFKVFDGRVHVALNNYLVGQNALAVANEALDTFTVLGHYNEPPALSLTESAVNRLPDGTWLAICRQEGGDGNYTFATSVDGRRWSVNVHRECVATGAASKPTFDRFGGTYYLGWQDRARVGGVGRSVFNVDVSADGARWERKYRFETPHSFQYPTFREAEGRLWLTVTQGDNDPSRKERIMFGRLE